MKNAFVSLAAVIVLLGMSNVVSATEESDRLECSRKLFEQYFKPAWVTALDLRNLIIFKRKGFLTQDPNTTENLGRLPLLRSLAPHFDEGKKFGVLDVAEMDLRVGDIIFNRMIPDTSGAIAVVNAYDRVTFIANLTILYEERLTYPATVKVIDLVMYAEHGPEPHPPRPGWLIFRPKLGAEAPLPCR